MFTGIIEHKGKVTRVRSEHGVRCVTITKPVSWKLQKGQSIAVDGVCSTVVRANTRSFDVEYMPETLRKTTAGRLVANTLVNLERSLVYGDRIEGHLVQGHVEGLGRVKEVYKEGRSTLLTLRLPAGLSRSVIAQGSITLAGVSLTIARRHGPLITVALVPHTLSQTTLGGFVTGDLVNVETDMYLRLLQKKRATVMPHAAKTLRKAR